MKNYADREGCYLLRPITASEICFILHTDAEFSNCFMRMYLFRIFLSSLQPYLLADVLQNIGLFLGMVLGLKPTFFWQIYSFNSR